MEIRPAEDFGGGVSRALRHAASVVADRSKLVGYATNSGLSECSGENGGTGATAGSAARIRQQAGIILVPPFAISPQQAPRASDCIVSTQADTGIAVHKTTAASMSNATFLPQRILVVSKFQL